MLVLEEDATLLLITQVDHAHLARDLLSLWIADGLPMNPRRDEILTAAAEHDNGWRELDAAPPLEPSRSWPYDFRQLPPTDRRRVWKASVKRSGVSRWSALLIQHHARSLLAEHRSDPAWKDLFVWLDERRAENEEHCSHLLPELEADYSFLSLSDTLSLGACGAWGSRRLPWQDYDIAVTLGRLVFQPFPFAGSLQLRVAYRRISKRDYRGGADLGAELASAHWQYLPVRVEPATSP
ncbi:MAG: DUF3891 family protein [Acidobacteriota bacterium]|nr:DUF3891 family protein [Acidobacteriota bacterium]